MAAKIQEKHPSAQVELIKGGGGDFIVTAGGRQLWNKNASGKGFPEGEEVLSQLSG